MSVPPAAQRAVRVLDLALLLLLGLLIVQRTMTGGLDVWEPGTAFFEVLLWFAAFLWCVRAVLAREARLVPAPIDLPLAAFLALAALAVHTAGQGGNVVRAGLLWRHWAADTLFFLLLLHHGRTRERRAFLLASFLAAVAVISLYAVYQRAYGLAYLRAAVEAEPEILDRTVGEDPSARQSLATRVASDRVTGPYGYANALAGLILLGIGPLWFVALAARRGAGKVRAWTARWGAPVLAVGATVALAYTGSRGAHLAYKVVEVGAFALLARRFGRPRRPWAEAFSYVFLLSAAGAVVSVVGSWAWRAGPAPVFTHAAEAMQASPGLAWLLRALASPLWMGPLLLGLAWAAEIPILARLLFRERPLRCARPAKWTASLVLAGCVFGGTWSLSGAPGAPPAVRARISGVLEAQSHQLLKLTTRRDYWIAGIRMALDHPWRGVGLDQYGVYYTQYKPITGWAVQRAHNTYIQLAADGGVFLLAAWLAIWVVFLRAPVREDALPPEPTAPGESQATLHKRLCWCGAGVVIAALGFTYLLFRGLGIEFFYQELWAPSSARAAGRYAPLVVHGLTHLVLLPAGGAVAFVAGLRVLLGPEHERAALLLIRAGLVAVLVHLTVDFYYYMQMHSALMWMLIAVGLLYTRTATRERRLRLPASEAWSSALVVALVAFFGVGGWYGPLAIWRQAITREVAESLLKERQVGKARRLYEELARESPQDPELQRQLAATYLHQAWQAARALVGPRPGLAPGQVRARTRLALPRVDPRVRRAAVAHAARAVERMPEHGPSHAYLGRTILDLFPQDRARLERALQALRTAHELHPYKPEYLADLGEAHARLGEPRKALAAWRQALALDADERLTDERAQLSDARRRGLERAVERMEQELAPGASP